MFSSHSGCLLPLSVFISRVRTCGYSLSFVLTSLCGFLQVEVRMRKELCLCLLLFVLNDAFV